MKRMKSLWICVLILLLLLALCGCDEKGEPEAPTEFSGDYKELETLLNRGQYDAAITWIETLRENAEYVPPRDHRHG